MNEYISREAMLKNLTAEMKCSCCKRYNTVTFVLTLDKPDFCQLCGARMDGDSD